LSTISIPLFPLRTVLFPDGPPPRRLPAPRDLEMISAGKKQDTSIGVVLATPDSESADGDTFTANRVGTLAKVTDWYQGSDGILGVTACGSSRFSVMSHERQADGLYVGEVELLANEPVEPFPEKYVSMANLLEAVIDDLGLLYTDLEKRYDDATWVGYRFAEVLPISLDEKQFCLELSGSGRRLEFLQPLPRSIRKETSQ
jgi:Lon protease-like protein